jgi:hypothetical protein
MNKFRLPLVLVVLAGTSLSARAGILFGKKLKPKAVDRVPVLIATLRSDPEERRRAAAAQELRDYDPVAYQEIVPALIEALQHDPKEKVRSEAVQSLARLRPISQAAGMAIEQAVSSDTALRVRLQARSALLQYHVSGYREPKNGYREPKKEEMSAPTHGGVSTDEPPLAPPLEPPAAKPANPQSRGLSSPQLIPVTNTRLQPVPVATPTLKPVGTPLPIDEIPDLTPPK